VFFYKNSLLTVIAFFIIFSNCLFAGNSKIRNHFPSAAELKQSQRVGHKTAHFLKTRRDEPSLRKKKRQLQQSRAREQKRTLQQELKIKRLEKEKEAYLEGKPSIYADNRSLLKALPKKTHHYYISRRDFSLNTASFLLFGLLLSSAIVEGSGKVCDASPYSHSSGHMYASSKDSCLYTREELDARANLFYGIPYDTTYDIQGDCSASSTFETCRDATHIIFAHNSQTNTSYTLTRQHPFTCLPRQDIGRAVSGQIFRDATLTSKGTPEIVYTQPDYNAWLFRSTVTKQDPLYNCFTTLTTQGYDATPCLPREDDNGETTAGWQITHFNVRKAGGNKVSITLDNFPFENYLITHTRDSGTNERSAIQTNPRVCIADEQIETCFRRRSDHLEPLTLWEKTLDGFIKTEGDYRSLWHFRGRVDVIPDSRLSILPLNLMKVIGNGIFNWKTVYSEGVFCPFHSGGHKICFPDLQYDDFMLEWGRSFPEQSSTAGTVALLNGQEYDGRDCVKIVGHRKLPSKVHPGKKP
jgi:hypothetical protein